MKIYRSAFFTFHYIYFTRFVNFMRIFLFFSALCSNLAFILVQNNDYFLTIFHILCKRFQFVEDYKEKSRGTFSFLSENPSAFYSSICNLSPISSFCCLMSAYVVFPSTNSGWITQEEYTSVCFNQTCKELHAHHRNHLRLIVNSRKTWFTDSCIF